MSRPPSARLFMGELRIGGHAIRTTGSHLFYVHRQGWKAAQDLQPGDLLRSDDGQWLPVEAITDSGEVTTVYNMMVAEYHTYFVGRQTWGFSV